MKGIALWLVLPDSVASLSKTSIERNFEERSRSFIVEGKEVSNRTQLAGLKTIAMDFLHFSERITMAEYEKSFNPIIDEN